MKAWDKVSKALNARPLVCAALSGAVDLRAERYFFQVAQRKVGPLETMGLICHLGGARASEGRQRGGERSFIPSSSAVLPAACATEWVFDGAIDVAIFYFLDTCQPLAARLQNLVATGSELQPFDDPLVSALAQRIVEELARGSLADGEFVERLSALMVEQACRVLEGKRGARTHATASQLGRLEMALEWIKDKLAAELSVESLAGQAGISASHFRRVFTDAMGMPPHRYILRMRLERARELLTRTDIAVARVTAECGFTSQSHMTAQFRMAYGVTPARMRRMARR